MYSQRVANARLFRISHPANDFVIATHQTKQLFFEDDYFFVNVPFRMIASSFASGQCRSRDHHRIVAQKKSDSIVDRVRKEKNKFVVWGSLIIVCSWCLQAHIGLELVACTRML